MTDPSTHQARRAASLAGIKQQEEAVSKDNHRWVPNVLSDQQGNVCRECGLVSEAYSAGDPCTPHPSFQGIPGFPRKQEEAVSDNRVPERWREHYEEIGPDGGGAERLLRDAIEEIGAAEAALSEAQQALSKTTANYALSMSTANRDIESLQQQVTQQAATIAEARQERDQVRDALEMLYDKYEDGPSCTENGDSDGSYLGNAVRLDGSEEDAILKLIRPERVPNLVTQQAATLSEMQRERDKTFAENERLSYQKIDDDAQIARLNFVYEEDQKTLAQQAATIAELRDNYQTLLDDGVECRKYLTQRDVMIGEQAATISTFTAILKAVEWCAIRTSESESKGAIHHYYCCPICRVDQHIGIHGCSCDIGKALASIPK